VGDTSNDGELFIVLDVVNGIHVFPFHSHDISILHEAEFTIATHVSAPALWMPSKRQTNHSFVMSII